MNSESLNELLKQYDELQSKDIKKNYDKYSDLLGKISIYDIDKAMQLWDNLLKNNEEYLKNNNISMSITGFVLSRIMFCMREKDLDLKSIRKTMFKLLRENPNIMNYCFGISYSVNYMLILECIKYGDKELAENIFELIYNNPQKALSNDDFILNIFRHFPLSVSSEEMKYWNNSFEVLEKWVERIELPSNLSDANIMLADFKELLIKTEKDNEFFYNYQPKKKVNNENKEKRVKQLVSSYESLINNFEKNVSYFSDIIAKMSKYDVNLAAEMWCNILEKFKEKLTDYDYAYSMCGSVYYEITNEIGEEEACLIYRNNPNIMNYCFGVCIDVNTYPISNCLKYGFYEEAIKIFDLEMNNNNKINSNEELMSNDEFVIEILKALSDNETYLNEDGISIIKMWAERIENEENKAKANICIMILEDVFEANSDYDEDD